MGATLSSLSFDGREGVSAGAPTGVDVNGLLSGVGTSTKAHVVSASPRVTGRCQLQAVSGTEASPVDGQDEVAVLLIRSASSLRPSLTTPVAKGVQAGSYGDTQATPLSPLRLVRAEEIPCVRLANKGVSQPSLSASLGRR